jgi:hypothetical protein
MGAVSPRLPVSVKRSASLAKRSALLIIYLKAMDLK